MTDFVMQLGDFQFDREEVPERIPFGGEQQLAVHRLVGGTKVVDAMGAFSAPPEWSGWLRGPKALARARALDAMRVAGAPVVLKWSELVYAVLVREFRADFERFYQIPYHITCEVVEDLTLSTAGNGGPSIDSLINGDIASADSLVSGIGSISLSSIMGTVKNAVSNVSSFANAAQSTLNSVLQPIAALRNEAQSIVAQVNNTLVNVTTLGGILPNNPIARQVQTISGQILAAQQLPALIQLDRVMGRVQLNVGSIYASAKQVTVAGGNLMDMAAKEWGDAMAWTGLAKANPQLGGDPQLPASVQTVTIPPSKDQVGGLVNS